MNLESCDECGVVVDLSKIDIPKEEDYSWCENNYPSDKFQWYGDNYYPFIECPCCQEQIIIGRGNP